MAVLYGGGTLLIREARVRWKMGWSIIFLAIAYGILEEGVMVQSFFNHHHEDLDKLSRYGMFLGTQWPWALGLTMYHATISTMIPIMIVDMLFPSLKNTSFIKKKRNSYYIVLLAVEVIIFTWGLNYEHGSKPAPYIPNLLMIFIWTLITLGFVYLGYKFRDRSRIETKVPMRKPFVFALLGFTLQLTVFMFSSIMAENSVPAIITVGFQLIFAIFLLMFVFRQIYNEKITVKHKSALIAGSLMPYILLTPLHEFVFGAPMIEVGITGLILLIVFVVVVNRQDDVSTI